MTVANGGGKGRPLDFYPTPESVVARTVGCLPDIIPSAPFVVDVGAGTGVYGREVRMRWPGATIWGIEINEKKKGWVGGMAPDYHAYDHIIYDDVVGLHETLSAFELDSFGVDLVIGNPPYSLKETCVAFGMNVLRVGGVMAYLLPLDFGSSLDRYETFFSHRPLSPVAEFVLVTRPTFFVSAKGSTNDTRNYAWYVWIKDCTWRWPTMKSHLNWKYPFQHQMFESNRFDPEVLTLRLIEDLHAMTATDDEESFDEQPM